MLAVQAQFLAAEVGHARHDPARILSLSEQLSELAEQLHAMEQMVVPPHLRTLPRDLPGNVTRLDALARSRRPLRAGLGPVAAAALPEG